MSTTQILALVIGIPFLVLFVMVLYYRSKANKLTLELKEVRIATEKGLKEAQASVEQQLAFLASEETRIKEHYEAEATKAVARSDEQLAAALRDLEALRKFSSVAGAEKETSELLAAAMKQAEALRADAQLLLERAKSAAEREQEEAKQAAQKLHDQAERHLEHAHREALKILAEAERKARETGGEAFQALRDKQALEQAAKAIANIIEGYGDKYVVPTHSVVDELAESYGHTEAGQMLASARARTKRMVELKEAADCDYAESNRRETAIRFVVDAFNGRVDALLSEAEHENIGTLEQRIRDAFNVVNLNGKAFRDARILPEYLEARLDELKWTIAALELREREREEQRRIKEQIREEEKARREYERAAREAADEEERLKRAMAKAQEQVQHASAQERAEYEAKLAALQAQLAEAEARNQRALSMAEQTKKGNVYIISNVGSFGDEVFKIGMTRRLEPMDRIWELSDASVPFDFDVHAMIPCEDAPALEAALHGTFEEYRINKVNYRKEFFRVSLERIRELIAERGIEAHFTLLAEAREYRESLTLDKMSPAERARIRAAREEMPETLKARSMIATDSVNN